MILCVHREGTPTPVANQFPDKMTVSGYSRFLYKDTFIIGFPSDFNTFIVQIH